MIAPAACRILLSSLLIATPILAAVSEVAATEQKFYFRSVPDLPKVEQSAAFPQARFGLHAAPWLSRIIKLIRKRRPPAFALDQVAVIDGAVGDRYLVFNWNGRDSIRPSRVEFHHVSSSHPGIRLEYLRTVTNGEYLSLVVPSGQEIFSGEPPIAVISGGGGSWALNYSIRLIQMKRNTVDITPGWAGRVVDVRDLDGDGVYEVITADDRWSGLFVGCGACGPFTAIVLRRKDGEFQPACREFASHYAADQRHSIEFIEKQRGKGNFHTLGAAASILMGQIQMGDLSAARNSLKALKTIAAREGYAKHVSRAERVFAPLIEKARKFKSSVCVLAATPDTGSHDGAIKRINHFRGSGR